MCIRDRDDIILRWLKGINGVVLNIIKMVMKLAPIGVFCLLANISGAIGFKVVLPMIKFLADVYKRQGYGKSFIIDISRDIQVSM